MIQWVLFDKDGTLIEFDQSWMKIGFQLVDDFIDAYREAIRDPEAVYHAFGVKDGEIQPGSILASGALKEMMVTFNQQVAEDVTPWVEARSQTLVDERVPENKWVEGMKNTLDTLKKQGYKLAIVTSDSKKGVDQFLDHTGTASYFDVVISTEANAVEKPDPAVLEPLFNYDDVKPETVVIVGDTPNDIQTGINAQLGMTVGVLTGVGSSEDLNHADHVIETANELVSLLNTEA